MLSKHMRWALRSMSFKPDQIHCFPHSRNAMTKLAYNLRSNRHQLSTTVDACALDHNEDSYISYRFILHYLHWAEQQAMNPQPRRLSCATGSVMGLQLHTTGNCTCWRLLCVSLFFLAIHLYLSPLQAQLEQKEPSSLFSLLGFVVPEFVRTQEVEARAPFPWEAEPEER